MARLKLTLLQQLEQQGWRYEPVSPGLTPCLTNAPIGKRLCVFCGNWQAKRMFVEARTICRTCTNQQQRKKRHMGIFGSGYEGCKPGAALCPWCQKYTVCLDHGHSCPADKRVFVMCLSSGEKIDEAEVKQVSIGEARERFDLLTFLCPKCKQIHTSYRKETTGGG